MSMETDNRTPLQRAIERKASSIIYYFVKECNVDISTLDEVNYHAYICIIASYIRT